MPKILCVIKSKEGNKRMIREELILQYLNNQLSPVQEKEVMEWAEQNPLDFQLTKEIWEHSSDAKEIKLFDLENEWNDFLGNLEQAAIPNTTESSQIISQAPVVETVPAAELENIASIKPEESISTYSRWKEWGPAIVAAALLLIVLLAYIFWPRTHEVEYYASNDSGNITLPDSTKVVVQQGSKIVFLSNFDDQENRIVRLDGIATFDISPNPDQPFIVETGNSGIKALGTIFEVDASQRNLTGVENKEGLVRFFDIEIESKFKDVKEGESFVYDGSAFVETTPKEPIIKTFPALPFPEPMYTVREIINYLSRISNGSTTTVGDNFDYNKRIRVDLDITNVQELIDILDRTPNVVIDAVSKNCANCFELRSLLVR